jgi:DNA primase catalytic subunit
MSEIRVKVTEPEYSAIKLNADILGMKIAPYIRKVAQNPNIINFDYSAIERHTKQVGKIVNSVNQLVFTIEVNNDYQPKEIEGIRDYVQEILETENKLLKEIRKQWERSKKGD